MTAVRTMGIIERLDPAIDALREDPDVSAASITYIGYKAPGSGDPRVGFQRMAHQGGQIFFDGEPIHNKDRAAMRLEQP